jgi:hypothetical protein
MKTGDPFTDNIIVASMTAYKSNRSKVFPPIHIDKVFERDSLDPFKFFVAIQDIYPTLIATVPFVVHDKKDKTWTHLPVLMPKNEPGLTDSEKSRVVLFNQNLQVHYYAMLKLNPERISVFPTFRPYTLVSRDVSSINNVDHEEMICADSADSGDKSDEPGFDVGSGNGADKNDNCNGAGNGLGIFSHNQFNFKGLRKATETYSKRKYRR